MNTDRSPLRRFGQWALVLVALAVGAIIYFGWTSPQVRERAVALAGEHHVRTVVRWGLVDADPAVRLRACQASTRFADADSAAELASLLDDPSAEVVDCALHSVPRGSSQVLVRAVAARWYDELMSDTAIDGDRACLLSDRLREADRKGTTSVSRWLFECALDAPTAPGRECCTQSLRGALGRADATVPMVMPEPEQLADSAFIRHVPKMVRTAFALEEQRPSLQFAGDAERVWSLAVACEALAVGGARWRGPVSGAVAEATATPDCALEPATERTVRIWTAGCGEVLTAEAIRAPDPTVPRRLCAAIGAGIARDAVNEAQYAVQRATRRARHPGRNAEMMARLLDYSAHRSATSEDRPERRTAVPPRRSGFDLMEIADRVKRRHPDARRVGRSQVLRTMDEMLQERTGDGPAIPPFSR